MDLTASFFALHQFALRNSGKKMVEAFASTTDKPFVLRQGQDAAKFPKIRFSVSYSRLIESGRRTPDLSSFAERARSFLLPTLTKSPPDPGWSIWPNKDPVLQAYTTSKVLYGLGKEGVSALAPKHVEKAVSFLIEKTREFCAPASSTHPLLALLGFQCLHELDRMPRALMLSIGHWADRLLYSAEAHLSKGRIFPLPPSYILFVMGVLVKAMPDSIDDARIDRVVLLVSEAAGSLPAHSGGSLIRLCDYAVGASAIDVLLYLLESDRCRKAVLKCEPLLSLTFDWLSAHAVQLESGVHLYRADIFHDTNDIDLWFNCAVADLSHTANDCISALDRNRMLRDLGAEPPAAAYAWADLKVGGFRWVKELEHRLLAPARERIPRGQKLEQNGIVLFGPPGTTKTSVAESIAKGLGNWPLVTVGPGEILQEGPDRIFAMIDQVFRRLTRLSEAVVLFDEFELLVLDRAGSSPYSSWHASLITDVMLPWFKALHDCGLTVYIIATNDIESIDSAIRRARRFDFILPVAPPSKPERLQLIQSILQSAVYDCKTLNKIIDGRATIGEVVQWAQEVKASHLDMNAAQELWSGEFAASLQISKKQYDKFLKAAKARTFPPSMK